MMAPEGEAYDALDPPPLWLGGVMVHYYIYIKTGKINVLRRVKFDCPHLSRRISRHHGRSPLAAEADGSTAVELQLVTGWYRYFDCAAIQFVVALRCWRFKGTVIGGSIPLNCNSSCAPFPAECHLHMSTHRSCERATSLLKFEPAAKACKYAN